MIYENGSEGTGHYGVSISQPFSNPTIRNNTIVHNSNEGICFTEANYPDIRNCIIWYNNVSDDLIQLSGYETTHYSCVTDPNDLNGSSIPDANGNITCDPNFAYDYPEYGYYHLSSGSHCKDMGDNTYVGQDETDIDTDDRIIDGGNGLIVDMGADEVACENVSNEADWNADGIVNLHEFSFFSQAWLRDNTDPNWLDTYVKCDLFPDGQIDIADLQVFSENWLWQACWRLTSQGIWMMSSGSGGDSGRITAAQSIISSPVLEQSIQISPPTVCERVEQLEELIYKLEEIRRDYPEIREEYDGKYWRELIDLLWEEWVELVEKCEKLNKQISDS